MGEDATETHPPAFPFFKLRLKNPSAGSLRLPLFPSFDQFRFPMFTPGK